VTAPAKAPEAPPARAAQPIGPPAIAAIVAPVPAPSNPVLAARQPGVVPQADKANKVPVNKSELANRVIVILPQYVA
jgi:hypothetical protein